MHIGFLNPQGNFDSGNSHITKHPDFGGQLIYVKQVAIAIAQMGHKVDIFTHQIIDPEWPEFAQAIDTYPGVDNVRIILLPSGPKEFLPKELLWPHLVAEWIPNILKFYQQQGGLPDAMMCGVLIEEKTGIPFTFTAHFLGAQKMDKLERLQQEQASLKKDYILQSKKVTIIRHAWVIETDPSRKFQYEHQLQEEERVRNKLDDKLNAIEQQLAVLID